MSNGNAHSPRPWETAILLLSGFVILVVGIWQYSLVDPWETHYAEVARRMLQDNDWVQTKWQDEGFRSKPVLTFWLIASSFTAFGIGEGGGYSGEMASSPGVLIAVRLPFLLFGLLGIFFAWRTVYRMAGRVAAWSGAIVLISTPFYFFVSKQAITDMPMIACLIGSLMLFARAVGEEPGPLWRWRKIDASHILLGAITGFTLWQLVVYFVRFQSSGSAIGGWWILLVITVVLLVILWALHFVFPIRNSRQLNMGWFFTLLGISMLAKGLPAVGVAGLVCAAYIIATNQWRLLLSLRLPQGALMLVIVALPWHWAMTLADGMAFYAEYVNTHLFGRFFRGTRGDRGTFAYYFQQLATGMWPWVVLVPAALVRVFSSALKPDTPRKTLEFIVTLWVIVSVGFFAIGTTKFHHYILPAVPAIALLIGFWLADVLENKRPVNFSLMLLGLGVGAIVLYDLFHEHELFIEMFIFRYDRRWPQDVDLTQWFAIFGILWGFAFTLLAAQKQPKDKLRRIMAVAFVGGFLVAPLLAALASRGVQLGPLSPLAAPAVTIAALLIAAITLVALLLRQRVASAGLLVAVSVAYCLWMGLVYMKRAGTHWGQMDAAATYYRTRTIHGINARFARGRDTLTFLRSKQNAEKNICWTPSVETVLPETFPKKGDPLTVTLWTNNIRGDVMRGTVAAIGDHGFTVAVPCSEIAQVLKSKPVQPGQGAPSPSLEVDADVLLAWRLYWRGENFWSGDEIWGPAPDQKRVVESYTKRDKKIDAYMNAHGIPGRRYFVVTEAGHAKGLASALRGKIDGEVKTVDTTSNKFTLLSFQHK